MTYNELREKGYKSFLHEFPDTNRHILVILPFGDNYLWYPSFCGKAYLKYPKKRGDDLVLGLSLIGDTKYHGKDYVNVKVGWMWKYTEGDKP